MLPATLDTRGEPIAFVFSGSANGIVRSCHCPSAPWGGLAKRAWMIDNVRGVFGSNGVTVVDTGDMLSIDSPPGQAALMLKLLNLMSYDAVVIGDQELRSGLEAWSTIHREAGLWNEALGRPALPWLLGGYAFSGASAEQMALIPPWRILERQGLRVGIVSIVGPEAWRFAPLKPEGVSLTDPVDVINKYLEVNRYNVDFTVVLSHQGLDADRKLAAHIKDIDLIIGGHSQSLLSPPEVVNGIAICQAGKNGENLGVLIASPRKASTLPAAPKRDVKASSSERSGVEAVENPFLPTVVEMPRWRIAQQIVPLTSAVEDSVLAAELIDEYYAKIDALNTGRLAVADARSETNAPQLVIHSLPEPLLMQPGSTQTVSVCISNRGGSPLVVERVRSRSPWMTVKAAPSRIEPGAEATILLEVAAVKIDRFFRCEFTVMANDPLRRVVVGAFPGRVDGEMPEMLDVPGMLSNLVALAEGPETDATALHLDGTNTANGVKHSDVSKNTIQEASGLSTGVNDPISSAKREALPSPSTNEHVEVGLTPQSGDGMQAIRQVCVEYYYSPGCPECREIDRSVLPAFTNRFAGVVNFRKLDINVPGNYVRLARLQERLGVRSNEPVSMYVDDAIPILGFDAIQANLVRVVMERLDPNGTQQTHETSGEIATEKSSAIDETDGDEVSNDSMPPDVLAKRLRTFTIPAMIAAGLVDGINPCAFATIVFFISLLSVSGVKGGQILLVGTGYTLAVFSTYLLIGFGVFRLLQTLQGLHVIADALRWIMIVVLLLLSVLSLRDAWVFKRSARPDDVALQLPGKLKRRMHDVMRTRLRPGNLFMSALVIGVFVTLIESVCTGQVYLPTLVMLSRYAETRTKAFALLLLYNLMFVVPLILLIVAAYIGTRTPKFIEWSKRNVVWGKALMALLFVALAIVMFVI